MLGLELRLEPNQEPEENKIDEFKESYGIKVRFSVKDENQELARQETKLFLQNHKLLDRHGKELDLEVRGTYLGINILGPYHTQIMPSNMKQRIAIIHPREFYSECEPSQLVSLSKSNLVYHIIPPESEFAHMYQILFKKEPKPKAVGNWEPLVG